MKKSLLTTGIIGCVSLYMLAAYAEPKAAKAIKAESKFDFYLLATQWMPGWCAVGTGSSGAELDSIKSCQKQESSPLMYHGLWPERKDGSYPANCNKVPNLNTERLTFDNPFDNYLNNADEFLDHEWDKHGTCSNYYVKGSEKTDEELYYKRINNYFASSINLYQNIKLTTLPFQISVTELKETIHNLNSSIPTASIIVMCNRDQQDQQYLTGLWFCVDKSLNHYISCPAPTLRNACKGDVLTR